MARKRLTYDQALESERKSGANKANPQALLAGICKMLAVVHCVSPKLLYEGAMKKGLTANGVAKLANDDPVALGNLMFD